MVAYARPHDTQIVPSDGLGLAARINRVLTNGGVSRVELIANAPEHVGGRDYFEVEVGTEELSRLALSSGQRVRLTSRRMRLFRDQAAG